MNYIITTTDGETLQHHGIMGQRWGIRRYQNPDGTLTEAGKKRYAPNYSTEQRKRDTSVYGKSGMNRINRSMLSGESISSARSKEATRINSARRKATAIGSATRVAGEVGGGIAGYIYGQKIANTILKSAGIQNADQLSVFAGAAISAGMIKTGKMLGSDFGHSSVMALYGYDPRKYR